MPRPQARPKPRRVCLPDLHLPLHRVARIPLRAQPRASKVGEGRSPGGGGSRGSRHEGPALDRARLTRVQRHNPRFDAMASPSSLFTRVRALVAIGAAESWAGASPKTIGAGAGRTEPGRDENRSGAVVARPRRRRNLRRHDAFSSSLSMPFRARRPYAKQSRIPTPESEFGHRADAFSTFGYHNHMSPACTPTEHDGCLACRAEEAQAASPVVRTSTRRRPSHPFCRHRRSSA